MYPPTATTPTSSEHREQQHDDALALSAGLGVLRRAVGLGARRLSASRRPTARTRGPSEAAALYSPTPGLLRRPFIPTFPTTLAASSAWESGGRAAAPLRARGVTGTGTVGGPGSGGGPAAARTGAAAVPTAGPRAGRDGLRPVACARGEGRPSVVPSVRSHGPSSHRKNAATSAGRRTGRSQSARPASPAGSRRRRPGRPPPAARRPCTPRCAQLPGGDDRGQPLVGQLDRDVQHAARARRRSPGRRRRPGPPARRGCAAARRRPRPPRTRPRARRSRAGRCRRRRRAGP